MNVFIIGPEGSGKTVFMAMLGHFVAKSRPDLILEPLDSPSSQYTAATLGILERQEWPASNLQRDLRLLRWRFGRRGRRMHVIELADYAGQDMRQLLLETDASATDSHSNLLRQTIDNSEILVYMLDLGGLVNFDDRERISEDAWLLRKLLEDKSWQRKNRLIVVAKADLYSDMAADGKDDLAKLVRSILPDGQDIAELDNLNRKNVTHHWIASVLPTVVLDEQGTPLRIPALPLSSEGFSMFVDDLLRRISRGWLWWKTKIFIADLGKILRKIPLKTWLIGAVVLGLAIAGARFNAYLKESRKAAQARQSKLHITFKTGTSHGAGTDSAVTLTLFHRYGGSKEIVFRDSDGSFFENGQRNGFSVTSWPVKFIKKIEVSIENSGSYPAWQLDSISIHDKENKDETIFPGRWLGWDSNNPNPPREWKAELLPTDR